MGENEFKSSSGSTPRVREGAATRAKNHTVILNPHVAGGVRALLSSEHQASGGVGRVGGLEDPALSADPNWESPQVSSDLGIRKASAASESEPPAFVEQPESHVPDVTAPDLTEASAENVSGSIEPEPEAREWQEVVTDALEPESDAWDPLGLVEREVEARHEDSAAPELAPRGSVLEFEAGSQDFTLDPSPEFVHVTEDPMMTPAESRPEEIYWKACTQLVGFLVSFDYESTGSYLELRTGRLLVTSQPDQSSNCLVLAHETVSPSHAVMRVATGGSVQVLDQLSESGTRIRKLETGEEVLLSGEKAALSHGDVVSFGDRNFHVCLILGISAQA